MYGLPYVKASTHHFVSTNQIGSIAFLSSFPYILRMTQNLNLPQSCPTEATLAVIGGRWKVPILWTLYASTHRFGELSRHLSGITQKMLTQQLRELEADGLIHREVYPEVPPRVEYSMTPLGRSLEPVLRSLTEWGEQFLKLRPQKKALSKRAAESGRMD
jgi:DNA-binding HxlR family transcriptional regulator